jgi:hypothetical protein
MSSPENWADAWLNNRPMPPHHFPEPLLGPMHDLAERWLLSDHGPRRQVEEFVSGDEAYEVMGGLLYSGFCRDPRLPGRLRPVPVLVELLYALSPGADRPALERLMVETFARALAEWCRLHLSGQDYAVAP